MKKVIYFLFLLFIAAISNAQNKNDSLIVNINTGVNQINMQLDSTEKTLMKIKENTVPDSFIKEVAKNYVFSFIYEVFGYKSSSTSLISKIASVISLLFLLLRIYLFFSKKEDEAKSKKKFLNIYFLIVASITIFIPWTSVIFPNNQIDKSVLSELNKSVKVLNDEIDKLKSTKFNDLIFNINSLQKLRVDTIQIANEKSIKNIDTQIDSLNSSLKDQIKAINNKLDKLNTICLDKPESDDAINWHQWIQTILIIIIGIWVFWIYRYKRDMRRIF